VFGVVFFGKWERTWGGGRERSSGFLGILDEEAEEEGEGFESLRIL
jgi:hypothetical protein